MGRHVAARRAVFHGVATTPPVSATCIHFQMRCRLRLSPYNCRPCAGSSSSCGLHLGIGTGLAWDRGQRLIQLLKATRVKCASGAHSWNVPFAASFASFFLELLVIDCSAHLGRWQTSSRGPDSRGRLPIGPRDPPCVPSPRHASWPTPGAWRTWTKRACTNRHLRCRVMLPLPLVSHPAEALRLQRRLPCWGSMLGKRPPNQSFPALHWHATTRTQIGKCIAHLARQCCSDAQRCAARPHPEQGGR
mmetsp:Transcript_123585/g.394839  ORF Transcript_123585/g.394839 Transcript_123585/m.394839 type:complete len:247 (+) Transcript_123585:467-1207(+)